MRKSSPMLDVKLMVSFVWLKRPKDVFAANIYTTQT